MTAALPGTARVLRQGQQPAVVALPSATPRSSAVLAYLANRDRPVAAAERRRAAGELGALERRRRKEFGIGQPSATQQP